MIELYVKKEDGTYKAIEVRDVSADISVAPIVKENPAGEPTRGLLLVIAGVRHGIPLELAQGLPAAIQEALDAASLSPT